MTQRDWDDKYRERGYLWRTDPNQFIVDEISGMNPGTALDLGCGEGRNAVWLAEQGWKVTAVDFSPVAIEKAAELAGQRSVDVDFGVVDITSYQPPGNYDLVIVFYIHLPPNQLDAVIAAGRQALREGATLLIVGHDLSNLTDGTGGPQDPTLLYTTDRLTDCLAGLTIEKATTVTRDVETDDGGKTAIDTLVRARLVPPRSGGKVPLARREG